MGKLKTEIWAGLSTFMASMYIVVVNPAILSTAGVPFGAVLSSTVLVTAFASLAMGIYANKPYLVAPGMGMNAFFTFFVVKTLGISYGVALGAVFWAGCIFLLLSILPVRSKIIEAIPENIKHGLAVGIGLFLCFIGLQNAGFVIDNPATLVSMVSFKEPKAWIFMGGLLFTAALFSRGLSAALLIGILLCCFFALGSDWVWGTDFIQYKGFWAQPDFSLLGQIDFRGSLKLSLVPVILVMVFTGLFDGISTLISLDGMLEQHESGNLRKSLLVDSSSSILAGLIGVSPTTAYIESSVGISQGGKTGLSAIVAGLCFLPLIFFSPLLSLIPAVASNISLVIVGALMVSAVRKINWTAIEDYLPAFVCLSFIPFTYSISHGLCFGLLMHVVLKVINKKFKEVNVWQLGVLVFSGVALFYA
jgi:adenine/guanine/hypoxanthine permease